MQWACLEAARPIKTDYPLAPPPLVTLAKEIALRPDIKSLHFVRRSADQSIFPNQIYENPPQLVEDLARSMLEYNVKPEIEVFDLAMLYNARDLAELAGQARRPGISGVRAQTGAR